MAGVGLTFCTATGARIVSADDLGEDLQVALDLQANEPSSGRLAVTAPGRAHTVTLVVLGADLEVLGRYVVGSDYRFQFLGPDRLIGTGAGGRTSSWRVVAGRLDLDADKALDGTVWFPYPTGPFKLVPNQDPSSPVWLDPVTLDPVEEPKKTEVPLVTLPPEGSPSAAASRRP